MMMTRKNNEHPKEPLLALITSIPKESLLALITSIPKEPLLALIKEYHDDKLVTPHVSDMLSVIVLTLFVSVCLSICLAIPAERSDRHMDLNFCIEFKWKDI